MTRENAAVKSARYLAEHRLVISEVSGDHVRATCRGSGDVYDLGHDLGRGWFCSCPARSGKCAHLAALMSVTVRDARRGTR
jgi:hypothetical protein